jgi:2-polyprenyl-6-methoxyphenol hydroxylase-like FAD-dependent oxidoreductase
MRQTDIVIAGGGLAGSTAAAMLARDGFDVVLVDTHAIYPPELRCEKIDGTQTAILRRTGLADAVLRAGTFDGECWIARFGRVVEKRPGDQYGILYDTLVNTSARRLRRALRSSAARSRGSRTVPTAKPSRCRPASRFPRGWSWWRTASISACAMHWEWSARS